MAVALASVVALVAGACTSGDVPGGSVDSTAPSTPTPAPPGAGGGDVQPGGADGSDPEPGGAGEGDATLPGVLVLATHDGALDAYDGSADHGTTPVEGHRLHPADPPAVARPDVALSGQVCVAPDGSRRVVTAAADPTHGPGWAVLQLTGESMSTLGAHLVQTFAPTYAPDVDPLPHGCAFLPDGRLLTTDRGSGPAVEDRPGSGQLVLWFPPFVDDGGRPRACKVGTDLPRPGQIWVDDQDRALVATTTGVWRFSGPWPAGPHPDQGCDGIDATGAPALARPRAELLVPAGTEGIGVPGGIAGGPTGELYITSPADGTVTEHDVNGTRRRTVLPPAPDPGAPGAGAGVDRALLVPGEVAVGPDRSVFVLGDARSADEADDLEPAGAILRIRLERGAEPALDVLAHPVSAPSGFGLAVPTAAPGPASKA